MAGRCKKLTGISKAEVPFNAIRNEGWMCESTGGMKNMTNTNELMNVNALRMLSVAQVEAANSGHPGLPLGAAPMAYTLWSRFLNVNPKDPQWIDRDRFVLSAGHGSALHYSLLHLFGFDVSLEDLRNFRQLGSKTPGHPEFGHTPGVEATTGPLGQDRQRGRYGNGRSPSGRNVQPGRLQSS